MTVGFRVTTMSIAYLLVTLALLYGTFEAGGLLLTVSVLGWGIALAYMIGRDVFTSASHALWQQQEEYKKEHDKVRKYIRELEKRNTELSEKAGVKPNHEHKTTLDRSKLRRFLSGHGSGGDKAGIT